MPWTVFSQTDSDRVLFIIDSIPAFNGFNRIAGEDLKENEVFSMNKTTVPSILAKYSEFNINSIIYITTKEYSKRPDSLKEIPSMKQMALLNDRWCLKKTERPYSGRYINYYLNGRKHGEGQIVNGKLVGKNLRFFKNGDISKEFLYDNENNLKTEKTFFKNGKIESKNESQNGELHGIWEIYYPNGAIKQRSIFVNGKIDGAAKSFSSQGRLISTKSYNRGEPIQSKLEKKMSDLYAEGYTMFRTGNFKGSIKKFNKIISIDSLNPPIYLKRAQAKIGLRKFSEAQLDINKALEYEPFLLEARLERALLKIEIMKTNLETNKFSVSELNTICDDLYFFESYANYNNSKAKKAIIEYCE